MKISRHVLLTGLLATLSSPLIAADNYPTRPVKIVVPFAPGGFTDIVARLVSQQLSDALGQSFIIENRPGAGSTIGTDQIAKAAPDGYTLGMIGMNHITSHRLYKNLSYDPLNSFTPISKLVDSPYVLMVNEKVPVNTVQDFIALTKKDPTAINYASSGNGSTQHLMGALFISMTGAPLTHVPYRGSGVAMQDLAAGFVESSFAAISNGLPYIQSGKLKALAVTSATRSSELPDVPSLDEAGVAGYDASAWLALIGPADLPDPIVQRLNAELAKTLNTEESRKTLAKAAMNVSLSSPEELKALMIRENDMWEKVINQINIKID